MARLNVHSSIAIHINCRETFLKVKEDRICLVDVQKVQALLEWPDDRTARRRSSQCSRRCKNNIYESNVSVVNGRMCQFCAGSLECSWVVVRTLAQKSSHSIKVLGLLLQPQLDGVPRVYHIDAFIQVRHRFSLSRHKSFFHYVKVQESAIEIRVASELAPRTFASRQVVVVAETDVYRKEQMSRLLTLSNKPQRGGRHARDIDGRIGDDAYQNSCN
ncbi:unnamed protein product [Taenia asiatica]|uniref:Uncharacterized protein n=1 Tax=Taenia asiatica TaxID=60517 RepID=A0A0R3VWA6_TAEAS|nr:unnamed protein product [Taenia asiatica]